jgi:hypothetical protein
MNPVTFAWWAIGACVVYAVAVDENVYPWFILQMKVLRIWAERQYYRLRYHPDSPWVRYSVERNAKKMADELLKEFENK